MNSIGALVSQALIDMEINHEELITINKISKRNIRKINIDINLKDRYEEMKENLRNINEKLKQKTESMILNSVNSKSLKKWVDYGWYT